MATSGWLWKRGDIGAVLEEVYREILCTKHIRELAGITGHIEFEDALNHLSNMVMSENKVPIVFWAKKYPALQRFFELLSRSSLPGDDIKTFETILEQHGQLIRKIFFDITQTRQMDAMRELFGEIWPTLSSECRELYDALPHNSSSLDEQSFKSQGRVKIDESRRKLASTKLSSFWRNCTGTESPMEWSTKHRLPAECILRVEDAKSVIDAISNPNNLSAERLHTLHDELNKEKVFFELSSAHEKFLKLILPARYLKIGFSAIELSNWLHHEIGTSPNNWLKDERLRDVVEQFVKQRYDTQVKKKAVDKVHALSDTEAKKLLLKLINEIPDVGLSTLE